MTLPSSETGLLKFHTSETVPTQQLSPLFPTLTFSPKQDHTWYHSKSAKGSSKEINHRGTLHFLSSKQSGSFLLSTKDKKGFRFADRPEDGAAYSYLVSLGKFDSYKWILVLACSLYLIVTRYEPNENPNWEEIIISSSGEKLFSNLFLKFWCN